MKKCILLLLLVVAFSSCKKENEIVNSRTNNSKPQIEGQNKSAVDDFALVRNKVSVQNGVLVFEDIETLDAVANSLSSLSSDLNSVEDALSELGFQAHDSSDDDQEPVFPIFAQFANRFGGFNSLIEKSVQIEKGF